MKAADFGNGDDFADSLHGPGIRRVPIQGEMEPGTVVVREVPPQDPAQRFLIETDNVFESFPADGADHAFGVGVLPGRSRSAEDLGNIHGVNLPAEFFAEDAVAVALQVLGSAVEGKCLRQR
jgi:hypothetical protein